MAKQERREGEFGPMRTAEGDGAGVMVALDPDPFAACLQPGDPKAGVCVQIAACAEAVETVAEADDAAGLRRCDISVEAGESVAGLEGRQGAAAACGVAVGFSEVEIRDAEAVLGRPIERA